MDIGARPRTADHPARMDREAGQGKSQRTYSAISL